MAKITVEINLGNVPNTGSYSSHLGTHYTFCLGRGEMLTKDQLALCAYSIVFINAEDATRKQQIKELIKAVWPLNPEMLTIGIYKPDGMSVVNSKKQVLIDTNNIFRSAPCHQ